MWKSSPDTSRPVASAAPSPAASPMVTSVAVPWVVILGFLRIVTSRRVFAAPLALDDAIAIVDGWLARPNVVRLAPGDAHWRLLRSLLGDAGLGRQPHV